MVRRHPIRHRRFGSSLGGADDRGVAGAAAKVAGKRGVMIAAALQVGGGHRDDKTGGAKAALRAVMVDHRLLHGRKGVVATFAQGLGNRRDDAVKISHRFVFRNGSL